MTFAAPEYAPIAGRCGFERDGIVVLAKGRKALELAVNNEPFAVYRKIDQ